MTDMGNHSHPNGHRGEDGAAAVLLPPSAIGTASEPLRLRPLAPWPPQDTAPAVTAAADKPADSKRGIDGDSIRRASMWILAAGVAAIAAIVSYSHIYDLGRAHGGSGVAARLLPLSVDMLILVGELMLLHEADSKGRRFALGWVLVWSGILATLAANVSYGAQYGIAGAVIWGWPAYSFILAAGGMVAVVKRGAGRDIEVVPETAPAPDIAADKEVDKRVDIPAPRRLDKPQARTARKAVTAVDKAMDILRDNPGATNAEVERRAKVSGKTVTRARAELAKASS